VTRRDFVLMIVGGSLVLVIGAVIASDGTVPGWEQAIFHAINDLPGWLYPILWPGNMLGALFVVPIVAVAAVAVRQYWLALAVVIAGVLKLISERIVKAAVTRERPGTSIGADINARGDVSAAGESFVSGHAVLAAAIAVVVAPYVPPRGRIALGLGVLLVTVARVYVGAHNPLDVICGVALGVVLGALINLALGAPRRSRVAQQEVDHARTDDLGVL
jgi:membrane-associated phospholipid phosphatase